MPDICHDSEGASFKYSIGNGEDLHVQLVEIIHRVSGKSPEQIKPDDRLIEDIGIDSLGFYEILLESEAALGIRIPERDLLGFHTVEDIQKYLHDNQSSDVTAS